MRLPAPAAVAPAAVAPAPAAPASVRARAGVALALAVAAALLLACAPSSPSATAAPPAWVALVKGGALVLDVRSPGEWERGHHEGARLVPVDEVPARLAEIEALAGGKSKPIVVYCRSGNRSGTARETLLEAGFTNVVNAGGLDDVRAALR